MKTTFVSVLVSLSMTLLHQIADAEEQGVLRSTLTVDGTITFNPCSGEGVILTGQIMSVRRFESDASGTRHILISSHGQGITGVGMDTGTRYVASGPGTTITTMISEDGPFIHTAVGSFQMISPSSAENYTTHLLVRTIIDVNGELRTSLFSVVPECRD